MNWGVRNHHQQQLSASYARKGPSCGGLADSSVKGAPVGALENANK